MVECLHPLFFFKIYYFLTAVVVFNTAFSSCGKLGLLFLVVCRLLVVEHRL